MKNFEQYFLNESAIPTEGIKELLTLLGYDIMYHNEHKEYFFEAMIDGKIKTIWLNDYLEPNYTAKKYNV